MKSIFRSIINIKKDGNLTIPSDELLKNYKIFLRSKVNPEDQSYIKLYHWIEGHYRAYKELPSIEYIFEKAQKEGEEGILASLKDIATQTPFIGSDYQAILAEKRNQQLQEEFRMTLQRTWQAAEKGLTIGKKEIKGIKGSLEYLTSEIRKFRFNATGIKTESQVKSAEDGQEVIDLYRKRKKEPLINQGMFTYLEKIDDSFRGLKLGELMIVAAFVAQGKTTAVVNMAYNGIMQGLNGMFVAMEMNFTEMRDMFFTLHTCAPEWYEHPKYKNLAGKIAYDKVCYGELSDLEQEFFEASSIDFVKSDYGELFIYQPTDRLSPSLLEIEVTDRAAELKERGKTLDFLVVDYVGLMVQDKNEKYGDFNIDLNNIIKKLKNLAINFNDGRGLRVITPFQVNREGWKDAVKNDGVYKLTALSNANEAERSADHVISLYMSDEMKRSGMTKVSCLKHRKGAMFAPFEAHMDFSSKRLRDFMHKKSDSAIEELNINEVPVDA